MNEFGSRPEQTEQQLNNNESVPPESRLTEIGNSLEEFKRHHARELGLPEDIQLERLDEIIECVHPDPEVVYDKNDLLNGMEFTEEEISGLATKLGLPETASWQEISARKKQNRAAEYARFAGLPEDTPYKEAVLAARQLEDKTDAIRLGLPETATPEEVKALEDQRDRAGIARMTGWREDPLFIQAAQRLGKDPFPSWREILAHTLNVDVIHTDDMATVIKQLTGDRQWRNFSPHLDEYKR